MGMAVIRMPIGSDCGHFLDGIETVICGFEQVGFTHFRCEWRKTDAHGYHFFWHRIKNDRFEIQTDFSRIARQAAGVFGKNDGKFSTTVTGKQSLSFQVQ